MSHILLDTNIVIYFLKNDPWTMRMMERLQESYFHISIVTWIETLTGSFYHGKKMPEIAEALSHFTRLPITEAVGYATAEIIEQEAMKGKRKNFQDSVIAATALVHRMPLMTNNPRDFRHLKKLKLISP